MNRKSHLKTGILSSFSNYESAYHQLMLDLIAQQVKIDKACIKG